MAREIWTFGYQGRNIPDFKKWLEEHGAIVVDIRYQPKSVQPGWGKDSLSYTLRSRYVHLQHLGNVNYRAGPIAISSLQTGMALLREYVEAGPVVLMCVCRHLDGCHREVVAKHIERVWGLTIPELWPRERPLSTYHQLLML